MTYNVFGGTLNLAQSILRKIERYLFSNLHKVVISLQLKDLLKTI